ncbi:MAG: chemotaxis protein CheD [Spirochaetales bacterium]|nr:chemotaxis protein CheD [Spirochaetales bacterium]
MNIIAIDQIINVFTGEVFVTTQPCQLVSRGIGSCVVVAAFCRDACIGGLAHIMLPGRSPKGSQEPLRYAHDGISRLFSLLEKQGAHGQSCVLCLAGGGNVLRRDDDTICMNNITSIFDFLEEKKLAVAALSLGGYERRSVRLDVAGGCVYCTGGEEKECRLFPRN